MQDRVCRLPPYPAGPQSSRPLIHSGARLERAYGQPFSETVKQAIREATTNFLRFEPFERAAEPVSLAREAGPKGPESRQKDPPRRIGSRHHRQQPRSTRIFLIKRHFADETVRSRKLRGQNKDQLVRLRRSPGLLRDACTPALAELEGSSLPGHREGDCWRGWVRNLTSIARETQAADRHAHRHRQDRAINLRLSWHWSVSYSGLCRLPPRVMRTPMTHSPRRSNAHVGGGGRAP